MGPIMVGISDPFVLPATYQIVDNYAIRWIPDTDESSLQNFNIKQIKLNIKQAFQDWWEGRLREKTQEGTKGKLVFFVPSATLFNVLVTCNLTIASPAASFLTLRSVIIHCR